MKHLLPSIFLLFSATALFAATDSAGIYEPYEIPIPISQSGISNVWEYPVSAVFTSPTQRTVTLGGFYHSRDLWVVRIAPDELGTWNYSVTYPGGSTNGSFVCIPSSSRGFIIKHPGDPKRLIYSGDGRLYAGVGFDDCIATLRDSILDFAGMDGGFRPPNSPYNKGWNMPYSQYMLAYGDIAGFNLYRYSDGNCQYSIVQNISRSGNTYDSLYSLWTDTLFTALRAHGFHIYMTILDGPQGNSSDTASMAAVNRYTQYCIDRYGALVDFWELTNESTPDSLWIARVADYIHAHDPYHHLVSMSWQTPAHPSIDIISPHWYGKEADNASDLATQQAIDQYSAYPKPVIFGEQGDGGKWDSTSAMRMRGRLWSAFFNEGIIDFWNTSWTKDCCNEYLGWENRRYVRALQNFCSLIDSGARKVTIPVSPTSGFRAYGLRSALMEAVYIRNAQDEKVLNSNVQVTVDAPSALTATWYDVHTGHYISSRPVQSGTQTIQAPPFVSDIALFIGISGEGFPDHFSVDVSTRTMTFFYPQPGNYTESFTLYNHGTPPVTINNILLYGINAQDYSIRPPSPIGTQLGAGDSTVITVAFSPSTVDTSAAMLSIVHTASPAWENIALSGTGNPANLAVRESNIPLFPLFNAYPNPFTSTVMLHIAAHDIQSLKVYNLLGEEVADLTALTAAKDEIPFNAANLPAGAYVCRLISDNKLTETMITLVK
ncbi:MAG TPA: DUF5060 domain-containing protein [Candidatus Kapabacteria bacterium]|nr:DUF5060 domain-containing protein [Candidatus Kapabacteria bacterium]